MDSLWKLAEREHSADHRQAHAPHRRPCWQVGLSSHAFNLTPGSCSSTKLTQTYRRWAKDNDVMTREAHVRGSRAVDILAPRFSQIRKSLQSLGPVACEFSLRATIENVFRETTRPLHPLKHIVLLTAMFQDADRILEELMKEPTPQADYRPDPAPSKVLPQHKTEDIELLNRFKELTGKGYSVNAASELLGVSTYIGVRWAKTHDIYFTPRSKSMQPEVQDAVRGALRAGQGKTEIAKLHGVSVGTVDRFLGVEREVGLARKARLLELTRTKKRGDLMAALERVPHASLSELRKTTGSGISWLAKHDREWLTSALPTLWKQSS